MAELTEDERKEFQEVKTFIKDLEEGKIFKYELTGSVNLMRLPHPREGPGTHVTVGLSPSFQQGNVGSLWVRYRPGLELGNRFNVTLFMTSISEKEYLSRVGVKFAPPPGKELSI